ncbi:MAG: heterodisulfide reductase subunit C [Anaerolineaceae bacterium]|jgi:heterodisulfide reductase subunit C|nr:MAG: heterodisulfide reductase subunit C [Anaerolineaceae bacterium]
MPTTQENWNPGKAQDRHPEVSYEEKEKLFLEVKNDPRYEDFLYGCYECGICVSTCPSARFYDYSPRVIAQAMAREDIERVYDIISEDIWNCAQCFSCLRCPRGNNPGGLVTLLREVAVKNGLQETKDVLQGYSRVIYKVMLKGNQVSPDMLQPDFFPDWGPWVGEFSKNMPVWRKAIPVDTLRGVTDAAWKTNRKTLLELYTIWFETGNMDIIKEIDEGLHDLLADVMQEELEEG